MASDLARALGVSDRTVRRAAARGLVRAHRRSPHSLTIDVEERAYLLGHWSLLDALVASLRTESNVAFAALFGSAARGDDRPDSDIDLLVDLREDSFERVVALEKRLGRATRREVQITRLSDAAHRPRLLVRALADARVLVDREERWPRLQRSRPRLARAAEDEVVVRRRRTAAQLGIRD